MADIKNDATLNNDLISVWLSDSSGLTTDLHGSNDLTNSGVSLTTGKQSGDAGDFELSEGDYEYITDASQTGLAITGDLWMAAWIYIETLSGDLSIISKGGTSGSYGYDWKLQDLQFMGARGIGFLLSGNGTTLEKYEKAYEFAASTWYHIGISLDISAKTMTFYVNGSSIGTDATGTASSIYDNSADVRIGAGQNGATKFDGVIHQLCVGNATLAGSGFSSLYNSGDGIVYEEAGGGSTFIPIITMM